MRDPAVVEWEQIMGGRFEMTDCERADLRLAISDPGATTPRRMNEYLPSWSARAAEAVVAKIVARVMRAHVGSDA